LYTKTSVARFNENPHPTEVFTMASPPLSPEQESRAQELAQAFRQAADEELLAIARALVATDESTLFGDTEFQVRDLVQRIGAKAYQTFLAQKKTATAGRP
jgi:hypothetical protein